MSIFQFNTRSVVVNLLVDILTSLLSIWKKRLSVKKVN